MFPLTINLYDTGALRASAISWALALTLTFRVLIVVIASLMLLCGLCFEIPIGSQDTCPASLRGCQASLDSFLPDWLVRWFPRSAIVSELSSIKGGNLSRGLLID